MFSPQLTRYNGHAGPFEAYVNRRPVQPPQRKGRLLKYSRNHIQFQHPSCKQLKSVIRRYFFALYIVTRPSLMYPWVATNEQLVPPPFSPWSLPTTVTACLLRIRYPLIPSILRLSNIRTQPARTNFPYSPRNKMKLPSHLKCDFYYIFWLNKCFCYIRCVLFSLKFLCGRRIIPVVWP